MKLTQFKDPEWDGTFQTITKIGEIRIVLLKFNVKGVRKVGRRNLLAINDNDEILWIAEAPTMGFPLGAYHHVYLDVETLYAWYESTHVTLDPINGKILDEKFVK